MAWLTPRKPLMTERTERGGREGEREREREREHTIVLQSKFGGIKSVMALHLYSHINGGMSQEKYIYLIWTTGWLPYKCERDGDSCLNWAEKPYTRCLLRLPWLPVQGNSRLWSAGYVYSHSMVFAFQAQEFVLPFLSLSISLSQKSFLVR